MSSATARNNQRQSKPWIPCVGVHMNTKHAFLLNPESTPAAAAHHSAIAPPLETQVGLGNRIFLTLADEVQAGDTGAPRSRWGVPGERWPATVHDPPLRLREARPRRRVRGNSARVRRRQLD